MFSWHLTKTGDLPENYKEYIQYTLTCAEYTPRVLAITARGRFHILRRKRKITEEFFSWSRCGTEVIDAKSGMSDVNVIMWTFLPNTETINEFKNKFINK